jgi:ABC-type uncharacterized transport system substrate-binding protein
MSPEFKFELIDESTEKLLKKLSTAKTQSDEWEKEIDNINRILEQRNYFKRLQNRCVAKERNPVTNKQHEYICSNDQVHPKIRNILNNLGCNYETASQ